MNVTRKRTRTNVLQNGCREIVSVEEIVGELHGSMFHDVRNHLDKDLCGCWVIQVFGMGGVQFEELKQTIPVSSVCIDQFIFERSTEERMTDREDRDARG